MPSQHTTAAAAAARAAYTRAPPTSYYQPPTCGGSGTTSSPKKQRSYGEEGVRGVTLKGGYPSGAQVAVEASVEHQKVENLKRQVELLEAELRSYREAPPGSTGAAGGSALTSHEHDALEAKVDDLRKEALGAKLREKRALDEMAEAKELLSEQRAKFTETRQELTAEVIAYQRDLDEMASTKHAIEADLADTTAALKEREEFMQGFDAQVRLLKSQLVERSEERDRAMSDCEQLRVELNEERVQAAALREKYDNLRAHQSQLDAMRAAQAEEAEKATSELRLAKMALDAEQHARQKSDEDKAYLIRESASLEATMQSLAATADFIQQENGKLKRDQANSRVSKVVGRFMIRKMRDKLVAAQASEKGMRESQGGLHERFVLSEQKCTAIERELMITRRRQSERDAVYEQQRADASELSVENRMLLDRCELMLQDGQRYAAKLEVAEGKVVELTAELEVLRERAEVERALRALRPEDLAAVSRVNSALSDSIQSLLPRLASKDQVDEAGSRGRAH